MKHKNLWRIASFALIASMLLASCGGGKPAQPSLLRVWIQWGDNPQQLQELFDK